MSLLPPDAAPGPVPGAPQISLSTASVYPESTAHAFAFASRLGYDGVEVMVGIDGLSQQTAAVKSLSEHHGIPVAAIHSPCLLITQRVWGNDPWVKLWRSAEMAHEVGAEVVVVGANFRFGHGGMGTAEVATLLQGGMDAANMGAFKGLSSRPTYAPPSGIIGPR